MYFILLMGAISIFSIADAIELTAGSAAAKITWAKLSYLGVTNFAPLWLLFAAGYSRRSTWLNRRRAVALWLLPVLTLALVASNEWHGLIWPAITPLYPEPASTLVYTHGVGVWVFAIYSYVLILVGSYWLLSAARRSPFIFRRQYVLMVVSALLPWLANLVYLVGLDPWPDVDPTPIALMITGIHFAWSLYRLQIFNLAPVAREILFENIGDGVIVLNRNDMIIDMNPVARRWLRVNERAIGKNIFQAAGINATDLVYQDGDNSRAQLAIAEGDHKTFYDLTISPLKNVQGISQGRVIVLHDITRERALLELEQQHARQVELLNAITQATLSTPALQPMLQTLADRLGELFGADGAFLTLWEQEKQRTLPAAAYGPFREEYAASKLEPGELTMTESVLKAGRVLAIEDVFHTTYVSPRVTERFSTRAMLALPLIADGRKLGAALVSYKIPHVFTAQEIALGEQAAAQIALAVAKVQLYEAARQHNAHLEAMQHVSQVVASSLELNQIFEAIVKVLQDTFGYRYISIYRLNGDKLELGAQRGYPEELVIPDIPLTHGIMGRTARTRQPQFILNVEDDPNFLRASYDVESEICVPLLKEQAVLGTLNVESTAQRPLTETDLNLLITFGNQVTAAIANASLFEAEREQRKFAEALSEVDEALSESFDFETLLDRLLEKIQRVVPYDSASIFLLDEQRRFAQVRRQRGYERFGAEAVQAAASFVVDITANANFRKIFQTRKPLIVPDTQTDPAWIPTQPHIGSWACAPIIVQNQIAAFLSLDKVEIEFFRPEHAERLTAFCAQAAIVIENARLYAEVQRLAIQDELTGLYNRRGFYEIGRRDFERALRFKRPLSMLFIDVDEFKAFNNIYSYATGDQVLCALARRLKSYSREIDLVVRYGGDEFVILLPETDFDQAVRVAERLRQAVETERVPAGPAEAGFSVSIGVGQFTPEMANLEGLVDYAGKKLQEAKKGGKNRIA